MNKFAQLVYHEVLNKYNTEIQQIATFIIEEIDSLLQYQSKSPYSDAHIRHSLEGVQSTIYKDYHNVLDLDLRNLYCSKVFKEETLKHYDDFIIKLSKTIAQSLGGK